MRLLSLIVALFFSISIASAETKNGMKTTVPFYMYNAASEFNLDVALLYAICQKESNCRSRAINHDDGTKAQKAAGIIDKSYGLFQIKESTAVGLGFEPEKVVTTKVYKDGKMKVVTRTVNHRKDLLKPEVNAWYAAKLIRHLYDRYKDTSRVISAYNAGRPIKGNKAYVNVVLANFAKYKLDKRF